MKTPSPRHRRARNAGQCVHFRNDPEYLEHVLRGLASFSSGYASVVAHDGVCRRHDRYPSANSWCAVYRGDQSE